MIWSRIFVNVNAIIRATFVANLISKNIFRSEIKAVFETCEITFGYIESLNFDIDKLYIRLGHKFLQNKLIVPEISITSQLLYKTGVLLDRVLFNYDRIDLRWFKRTHLTESCLKHFEFFDLDFAYTVYFFLAKKAISSFCSFSISYSFLVNSSPL